MKLLVDIGNTRIKWCLLRDGSSTDHAAARHKGQLSAPLLTDLWSCLPQPDAVVISSVLGDAISKEVVRWAQKHWGKQPCWAQAQAQQLGVSSAYAVAGTLGVDRWMALIGAHLCYGGNLVVADCGTAVTVDVITSEGQHLGGVIMPGIESMRAGLVENTFALGDVVEHETELLGRDTNSAVCSGTRYAAASLLDRIVLSMSSRLGPDVRCLLTGGDANEIQPLLITDFEQVPDLVLKGLAKITEGAE